MFKMNFDFYRLFIFFGGVVLGVSVFVGYGDVFFVPNDFGGVVVTILSILAGFQMTLFSNLSSMAKVELRNKILDRQFKNSVYKKFYRQYGLFISYFVVIILSILYSIVVDKGVSDFLKRLAISGSMMVLIWSLEIPKLILQLRDEE